MTNTLPTRPRFLRTRNPPAHTWHAHVTELPPSDGCCGSEMRSEQSDWRIGQGRSKFFRANAANTRYPFSAFFRFAIQLLLGENLEFQRTAKRASDSSWSVRFYRAVAIGAALRAFGQKRSAFMADLSAITRHTCLKNTNRRHFPQQLPLGEINLVQSEILDPPPTPTKIQRHSFYER